MFLLAELVEIDLLKDFNLPENKTACFLSSIGLLELNIPPYLGKKT